MMFLCQIICCNQSRGLLIFTRAKNTHQKQVKMFELKRNFKSSLQTKQTETRVNPPIFFENFKLGPKISNKNYLFRVYAKEIIPILYFGPKVEVQKKPGS